MVHRRPTRSTNPFDSDDDKAISPRYAKPSAPPLPAYSNPFDDDDEPKLHKPNLAAKNPFDDDEEDYRKSGPTRGSSDPFKPAKRRTADAVEPIKQRSEPIPVDLVGSEPVKQQRPRRRDLVKEKISSISDDVASKASRVTQSSLEYMTKPRSEKNLMKGSSQDRKALLGDDDGANIGLPTRSEQGKATNERIGRALKNGTSLDGESVQELQDYGIQQAEETTTTVYNALRLAEEMKEGATTTSIQLHEQGEQIRRTHEKAVDIDHELGRGEKLLGSLGGLFSKTWKPKKGRDIAGPVITRSDSFKRKAHALEQRRALGIGKNSATTKVPVTSSADKTSQFQARIQTEFAKQDDALSDLSNILGELKEMSIDMGEEIQRQTHDLGRVEDDVTELSYRVKGANDRARKLLGR